MDAHLHDCGDIYSHQNRWMTAFLDPFSSNYLTHCSKRSTKENYCEVGGITRFLNMIITTKIVIALQARVGTSKTSVLVNRSAEEKKDAQKMREIEKKKQTTKNSYLNLCCWKFLEEICSKGGCCWKNCTSLNYILELSRDFLVSHQPSLLSNAQSLDKAAYLRWESS